MVANARAHTFSKFDHLPCKLMTWYNGWLNVARTLTVTCRNTEYGEDGSCSLTPIVGSSSKAFSISSTYADSEDLDEQLSLPHLRHTHLLNTIVT